MAPASAVLAYLQASKGVPRSSNLSIGDFALTDYFLDMALPGYQTLSEAAAEFSNGEMKLRFARPLACARALPAGCQNISAHGATSVLVAAYGKPERDKQGVLHQHDIQQSLTIDLDSGRVERVEDWLKVAHVVGMVLCWGLAAPSAVLARQFCALEGTSARWCHACLQLVVVAVTGGGLALGLLMAGRHDATPHPIHRSAPRVLCFSLPSVVPISSSAAAA